MQRLLGEAFAQLGRARRIPWADLLLVVGLAGLLFTFLDIGREWTGVHRPSVAIDLSPAALPRYTLFSLFRGLFAYVISLGFTIVYGYWAAKDRVAGRLLIPLLDILQSIPVLGFMPGLILALVALFPHSNIGLELAAVIMIFTGQAWNMTFSFIHSLRSVPSDLREVATVYRFNWWQRLRNVELPFATMGLVWNSMVSMAGGWFFLMITEAFQLGQRDFRLPGIGSYMSVAVERGRGDAMILAIVAMATMIVLLDQATPLPGDRGRRGTRQRATVAPGARPADRRPRLGRVEARPPLAARAGRRLGQRRRRGISHAWPCAALDRARHPVGLAGGARDWALEPAVAGAPTCRADRRILPRADAVSAGDRRTAVGGDFTRLGCHSADAARHAVVHSVQRHRRRHGASSRPQRSRP